MVVIAQMQNKEEFYKKIVEAVQHMYTRVSVDPASGFHFPVGRQAAIQVGYPQKIVRPIPQDALASFAGVAYHFQNNLIRDGQTVLDIGSGSGTDLIIAALQVGKNGRVVGIDLTPSMLHKANRMLEQAGINYATLVEGSGAALPFLDETFDIVISNGVINLIPDKTAVFQNIFRVLKPGGYLSIADIVLQKEVSENSRDNPKLWAECIVGALPRDAYLSLIQKAGFRDVSTTDELDYFNLSSIASTRDVAHSFGAHAVVIKAQKPEP